MRVAQTKVQIIFKLSFWTIFKLRLTGAFSKAISFDYKRLGESETLSIKYKAK